MYVTMPNVCQGTGHGGVRHHVSTRAGLVNGTVVRDTGGHGSMEPNGYSRTGVPVHGAMGQKSRGQGGTDTETHEGTGHGRTSFWGNGGTAVLSMAERWNAGHGKTEAWRKDGMVERRHRETRACQHRHSEVGARIHGFLVA